MNRYNSSTRDIAIPRRSAYGERIRRRKRRQALLLGILSVLIILLIIAIVFILRDIINKKQSEKPETSAEAITTVIPEESPADHPIELAYDGNVSTYMLSSSVQTTGAWLQLDFGEVKKVTYVGVVTNHETCYIRSADVEISADGDSWSTVGELTGTPSNSSEIAFTPASPLEGRYIRIILTSGASVSWAVNSFSARDDSYSQLSPVSASTGIKKASPIEETTKSVKSGYENLVMDYADIFKGFLICVNNDHTYVFPQSDVNILQIYDNRTNFSTTGTKYSYQIGETKLVLLDATALKALNAMCDDFYKETGIDNIHVGTNCGYRSKQTQEELYAKYPSSAAKPGTSDHNTGYGVNLNIYMNGTPYELSDTTNKTCVTTRDWLNANAAKYGFIRRYPEGKDSLTYGIDSDRYHYRYVGIPHAYYMTANDLCLEEYLTYLENNTSYSGNHLMFTDDNGTAYEIYYVPITSLTAATVNVPVPTDYPYTVSGNNYNGFIVTVTK